ncbi:MAG: hypothetical protein ACP5NF_01440 [Thermoanaerobaculum sp.]
MRKVLMLLCLVFPALSFAQERTLVPVVAWGAPGAAGNRWNTEVYLTNLTAQEEQVTGITALPLRVKTGPHPCLPPVAPVVVGPWSTKVLYASELNTWLGCPEEFVGGLVFEHGPGLLVTTRMTNTKGFADPGATGPLRGFSQEIPGVPEDQLPGGEGRFMIPTLAWHPNPCEGSQFDTYLYLANPGESEVTVRLLARQGEDFRFRLGDVEVQLPYLVKVPKGRVVQLALLPPLGGGGPCGSPVFFDLFFEADARVGVLASVVDRASNDPRTVLVTQEHRVQTP